MDRRKFIVNASIAGLTLPAFLQACGTGEGPDTDPEQQFHPDDFPLQEIGVQELQKMVLDGKTTVRAITEQYLNRIKALDQHGPGLHSVIEVNPDALAIADAMDAELKGGKFRGKLHGIPVLVKDNIDTADKMMNTAGSIAMEGNLPKQDAHIIRLLRASGAVLLGKTNLSEWANFRSNQSSSGWSSRGGQTRNPYVLDRNPCGSSSGSGTAVSANLCAVAIGTETNGSIICPSSINGIVGIKPTVGLWSRSGIIPISATQDTAGPMARTVTDAAILLGACIGQDERDPATAAINGNFQNDYTQFCDRHGLNAKRIGVEKSYLKKSVPIDALLKTAVEQLRAQGAEVIEVDFQEQMKSIGDDEYTVLLYEFKDGLNRYLSGASGKVKSLDELIAFNKAHASAAMPFFTQDILEASQAKGGLEEPAYRKAVKNVVETSRTAIDGLMDKYSLDAIIGPSYGPSWCTDHVNGDYWTGYGFSGPAAMAGYPHITVPMGFVSGLPIGLSFFGKAWTEAKLITLAYAYEQASRNRRPPEFTPTIL